MSYHVLGVRHHGPGSARHVKEALERIKPDLILLEGPAEADDLIKHVLNPQMRPPVSLLAYQIDDPKNACFYPFAEFSPEWQSIVYSQRQNVELRFFDLPLCHKMGLAMFVALEKAFNKISEKEAQEKDKAEAKAETNQANESEEVQEPQAPLTTQAPHAKDTQTKIETQTETLGAGEENDTSDDSVSEEDLTKDLTNAPPSEDDEIISSYSALDALAKAAGFSDGEQWWEVTFEQRQDDSDVFEASCELMRVLREEVGEHISKTDLMREAWMRKMMRQAKKDGFERIAIICGAFHAPALVDIAKYKQADDNSLLKKLPKVKVGITWVPWTFDRLSLDSGYGAGIQSPGFYNHLYKHPQDDGTLWLANAAKILRRENFDISTAHVIETVRLANTLAALRNLSHPGLNEFNEAITTVMSFGDDIMLKIVKERLIVGKVIGKVPSDLPKVPLVENFEAVQKKLRMPFTKESKVLTLDLRKELDLARSTFLHRLELLKLPWAKTEYVATTGNFKEAWCLNYSPEVMLRLIDLAVYGNTVEEATFNFISEQINASTEIVEIAELLHKVLPCNMMDLINVLIQRMEDMSATGADILSLLKCIPPLCNIVRYGTVRKFDLSKVDEILLSMLERLEAGCLLACINIDDKAAQTLLKLFNEINNALNILRNEEYLALWFKILNDIHHTAKVHPLLCGTATRILRVNNAITLEDIINSMSFYTSKANKAIDMAFYIEGFLYNSGSLLLIDDKLWAIVNNFVCNLNEEEFIELLPVLRRTFSEFAASERRRIGEKAKNYDPTTTQTQLVQLNQSGATQTQTKASDNDKALNYETSEAVKVIPLVGAFFKLKFAEVTAPPYKEKEAFRLLDEAKTTEEQLVDGKVYDGVAKTVVPLIKNLFALKS